MSTDPLDAHATAKPGEPTFTLQGGDQFAPECVAHWVDLQRRWAMTLEEGRQRDEELMRATQAERVLWNMQSYLAGRLEQEVSVEEAAPPVAERLDIWDFRIWAASRISNAYSELSDIQARLEDMGLLEPLLFEQMETEVFRLRAIHNLVEPRKDRHVSIT